MPCAPRPHEQRPQDGSLSRQQHPPLPLLQPLPRSLPPRAGGVRDAASRHAKGRLGFPALPSLPLLYDPFPSAPRLGTGVSTQILLREGARTPGSRALCHKAVPPPKSQALGWGGHFVQPRRTALATCPQPEPLHLARRKWKKGQREAAEPPAAWGLEGCRAVCLSVRPPEAQATSKD